MDRNRTSNDNEHAVVLGEKGNIVSSTMKVSSYLTDYGNRLDSKWFAEIERHGGARVLQDEFEDERNTREGALLRRWKHCGCHEMLKMRCSRRYNDIYSCEHARRCNKRLN